jgi:DNA-binding transcriptional regulator GbsR (MarR family)
LVNGVNPISELLQQSIVQRIKEKGNHKVHYVQEGPHWWWNDDEISDHHNF